MTTVGGTVPYAWPYDGVLDPGRLALVVAGAQTAWAVRSVRAAEVAAVLVATAEDLRAAGVPVVAVRHAARPGRRRPVPVPPPRGDGGWALAFPSGLCDRVVDANGVDGFRGGPLDDVLRARGVDRLLLGGFGHEAAVDSTLRSANDRGYECLVLRDAVAPFDEALGRAALHSVTMSGGIFGAVGSSTDVRSAIRRQLLVEALP